VGPTEEFSIFDFLGYRTQKKLFGYSAPHNFIFGY